MKGCLIVGIVFLIFVAIFGDNAPAALGIAALVFIVLFIIGGIADWHKKKEDSIFDNVGTDSVSTVTENDDFEQSDKTESKPRLVTIKLTKNQYKEISNAVSRGKMLCLGLSAYDDMREALIRQAANASSRPSYSKDDFLTTLKFLFVKDLFICLDRLGHKMEDLAIITEPVSIDYSQTAGQVLYATLSKMASDYGVNYDTFRNEILSVNPNCTYNIQIRKATEQMLPIYINSGASVSAVNGDEEFNLVALLRTLGHEERVEEVLQVYSTYSTAVCQAEDSTDVDALEWLGKLNKRIAELQESDPKQSNAYSDKVTEQTCKEGNNIKTSESNDTLHPMEELNSLIGLKQVKEELKSLSSFIAVNEMRKKQGLKVAAISYHCVFAGNPGTGKTTVARILAGIYKDLGILKKGQLIETDRSGLVAEYVGQTAVKTNKIIDRAIGGVLFIDEAYTLAQGGDNDYGREAIATLLKRMEDDRDRLVVVLAGYTNEIEQFINTNPGLRSRFNRYIHFDDYTEDELYQIFLLQAKKYDYKLSDNAAMTLKTLLHEKVTHKQKDFGNARYVRNLFESVIERQAVRLAKSKDVDKSSLTVITQDDFNGL